jgi:hypothetical protein
MRPVASERAARRDGAWIPLCPSSVVSKSLSAPIFCVRLRLQSLSPRISSRHTDSSPACGQIHTQPFAFRAPTEDDESVKMSNTTSRRSSAPNPAFPANRPGTLRLPKPQFLFDTNKPFSCTTNFATSTKQSTSIFLFDTNEKPPTTTHQSLITTHQSGAQIFHG